MGLAADVFRTLQPDLFVDTVRRLSLDREASLPAWFSAMSFLVCALFMLWAATSERHYQLRRAWCFWAALCMWASVDEAVALHEHAGKLLRMVFPELQRTRGVFYFSWVILALIVTAVLIPLCVALARRLPAPTRRRLGTALAVLVLGGVGMEMVGSWIFRNLDSQVLYTASTSVEEGLEFAGVGLLLRAVILHLRRTNPPPTLRLT